MDHGREIRIVGGHSLLTDALLTALKNVIQDSSWPRIAGILVYQLKWWLHMTILESQFTTHCVPICVKETWVFLLYLHTTTVLPSLLHQLCGCPLPPAILCSISWVSSDSVQCWH